MEESTMSTDCDMTGQQSNVTHGVQSAAAHHGFGQPEYMMEDEEEEEAYIPPEPGPTHFFVHNQVPLSEYEKQTKEYTKSAVDSLVQSPEYQRKYTRCRMCWCSWSEGQFNTNCTECGGYAMERPCPICGGKCGHIWQREVDLSHSNNEAHWDGDCGLPWKERQGYMQQVLMEDNISDDEVLEGFGDLTAS